jgi:CubicO group peptidase (beta-lactamase class C family)
VKDNAVVVNRGFGVSNTATGQAADSNTLFMIASNSKLFTGTAMALLDYQGRLSLHDKVTEHLPYFSMYSDTITDMVTVEDLLTHRMGFETFQGDFFNWTGTISRKQVVENMAKNIPPHQFRDTWGYCNAGFVAAGEVLHAVTDTTWDEFIQTHFFDPLYMQRSSTTHQAIAGDNNAAVPYTMFRNELIQLNYDNVDNIAACGGINSCSNDLTHWLQMQLNYGNYKGVQVLPDAVVYETRIPRSIVGDGHSGLFVSQHFDLYGLGIEMNDYEGREMVWHTGGANGFVTSVCMIPDESLGIAILTNTDANYFFIACLYQIIEAYFEMPYRNLSEIFYGFYKMGADADMAEITAYYEEAATYQEQASDLKKFTGTYVNDVYGEMRVVYEGNALRLKFQHHPHLTGNLDAISENSFICTYDPVSWGVKEIPFTVENGVVISATVRVNDFIDFGEYVFIKKQE